MTGSHLGPRGSARYVVTDRHGVRTTPSRPSELDPDASTFGSSVGAYARLDLARHVGDDATAVEENRALVAGALGLVPTDLAFMDQVHGAEVAVVGHHDLLARRIPTADALVTTVPGIALAVMVADCVPVVLADEEGGVIAVAHAGRKGVQTDVVGAVVRSMVEQGAEPGRIAAVVGPAICPSHYEVPATMRDEVAALVPQAAATSATGTAALHLRRAVAVQLGAAGVGTIDAVGGCTVEDSSLYSYRRDGATGRFAMLAWLRRG